MGGDFISRRSGAKVNYQFIDELELLDMARVSGKRLDKDLENEIFKQFWESLSLVNNSSKASDFFTDILSETEKLMLAKRFAIAVLVLRGKSATEIHEAIHVSYTNIGTVCSWVKNGKPGTKGLLEEISRRKNWNSVADKIEALLDKIPPRRHTDWAEEYKERKARTSIRFARKALR